MKNAIYLLVILFISSCVGTGDHNYGFDSAIFTPAEPLESQPRAASPTPLPVNIQVRFANPVLTGNTYTVDAQFKAEKDSLRLFGMNVRFFYPYNHLKFSGFTDFAPGYGKFSPDPPIMGTGNTNSGPGLFNFAGAATYVNGAVQILDKNQPITWIKDWTTVFKVKFEIKPDVPCPILIWEKKVNPNNGGFLGGSDGVTITVFSGLVKPESKGTIEYCDPHNWQYTGSGLTPKFGIPLAENCNQ